LKRLAITIHYSQCPAGLVAVAPRPPCRGWPPVAPAQEASRLDRPESLRAFIEEARPLVRRGGEIASPRTPQRSPRACLSRSPACRAFRDRPQLRQLLAVVAILSRSASFLAGSTGSGKSGGRAPARASFPSAPPRPYSISPSWSRRTL